MSSGDGEYYEIEVTPVEVIDGGKKLREVGSPERIRLPAEARRYFEHEGFFEPKPSFPEGKPRVKEEGKFLVTSEGEVFVMIPYDEWMKIKEEIEDLKNAKKKFLKYLLGRRRRG